jgi:hypothetical protein
MREIILNRDESYCSILDFYTKVAGKAGIPVTEEAIFNCRDICVTKAVQQEMMDYYLDNPEKMSGFTGEHSVSAIFLQYGPKASLEPKGYFAYRAEIGPNFVWCR